MIVAVRLSCVLFLLTGMWLAPVSSAAAVEPLFGHRPVARAVTGLAISPDNSTLAVSYDDSTLHLLEFKTGKDIAELDVFGGPNTLRFTPDGKILLSITNGGAASIDIVNRKIKHHFKSEASGGVTSLDVSPDGKLFACVGKSSLSVWNIETGVNLSTIDAHSGSAVNSVAISRDGSLMATAGNDKKVMTWNTITGQEQKTHDLPAKPLCIAFSPDGDSLLVSCDDQSFYRVNVSDGDTVKIASPNIAMTKFRLSADGTMAFIAGAGNEPGVLMIGKKRLTTQKFSGHKSKVTVIAVSSDGRFFASGDQDGQINVYPVIEAGK